MMVPKSAAEETPIPTSTTTTEGGDGEGGNVMMDLVVAANEDDDDEDNVDNKENNVPPLHQQQHNKNKNVVCKVSPFSCSTRGVGAVARSGGPIHVEVEVPAMCPIPLSTLRLQWQNFLSSQQTVDGDNDEESSSPLLFFQNRKTNINNTHKESMVDDTIYLDRSVLPEMLQQTCVDAFVEWTPDHRPSRPTYSGRVVKMTGGREIENSSNTQRPCPPPVLIVHPYILSTEEASTEEIDPSSTVGGSGGGDDDWTAACDILPLPHASLDGLWNNLILEPTIKTTLLQYAQSALLFSDRAVSSHVVTWNRMLLLYGPPGTGKTSLCRALAHKLAIRLGHRFPHGTTLLEVHSHSLFSKWFSTSGKLVSALFQLIRDMVQDDPQTLVCVLMDEVESLAAIRGGGGEGGSNGNGGDPSDAMRAVNSLLTSLDRLRAFPNVLVLATTNLTNSVDAAFVDRVDLKLHIGMPILHARYEILRSCIVELERVGIIVGGAGEEKNDSELVGSSGLSAQHLPRYSTAVCWQQQEPHKTYTTTNSDLGLPEDQDVVVVEATRQLLECAQQAEGLSGRSLRRLPLQAHAQFLAHYGSSLLEGGCSLGDFLDALLQTIQMEHASRNNMTGNHK